MGVGIVDGRGVTEMTHRLSGILSTAKKDGVGTLRRAKGELI